MVERLDLEQFYAQHFPVIRGKCARMLGDSEEAADIAQETFLRLWSSPVAGGSPAARASWIYLTATRLAIDRLRRSGLGVEVAATAENHQGQGGATDGAEGVVAAREVLQRVAARVDGRTLEVLVLSRFDRMTQDEVAQVTGLSSRQVRRILVQAEAAMAELAELVS